MSGEHDLSTAARLRTQFDRVLAESNSIVIDVSPMTFMDSSILGALLQGQQRANDAGLGFALVNDGGSESIERLLDVTGLRAQLPIYASRAEAETAVSAAGQDAPS